MDLWLDIRLLSDGAFGRGEGVAGLVDSEVEHEPSELPFIRGRVLKGLLVEECANLLFALSRPTAGLKELTIATHPGRGRDRAGEPSPSGQRRPGRPDGHAAPGRPL
jgi:hypothetical protein